MSLLKLKDAVVENIEEDIVDYYVFADTYSGVDTETTTNIIITLEDGRTIKL